VNIKVESGEKTYENWSTFVEVIVKLNAAYCFETDRGWLGATHTGVAML